MKNIFIAFVFLLPIVSCVNPGEVENAEAEKIDLSKMDPQAFVDEYFQHFNNHDWEAMAGMHKEKTQLKDPSFGTELVWRTREEIVAKYTELSQVFPDLRDSVVAVYPSGANHIIVEFVSTGSSPDGFNFTLPICTIMTIEDGLVSKDFTYYDDFEE